jgi:hypothetical protein
MTPAPKGRISSGRCKRPASFHFSAGAGRHRVWGAAFVSQEGLVVTLVGGEVPHVGAVAVSIPRPSLKNARMRSATTSVLAIPGHKEEELARPLAAELARALGRTTVVVAGIHIRRARQEDIERVVGNAGRALEAIIATVRGGSKQRARSKRTGPPGPRTCGGRERKQL